MKYGVLYRSLYPSSRDVLDRAAMVRPHLIHPCVLCKLPLLSIWAWTQSAHIVYCELYGITRYCFIRWEFRCGSPKQYLEEGIPCLSS